MALNRAAAEQDRVAAVHTPGEWVLYAQGMWRRKRDTKRELLQLAHEYHYPYYFVKIGQEQHKTVEMYVQPRLNSMLYHMM